MKYSVADIILIAVIFTSIDSTYLLAMKDYFNNQIKVVQGSVIKLNIYSAIACYIALVFGIYYFIIKEERSILDAFILGIVIYAVYETTTLALLKDWSVKTAIIDTLWGGILFSVTTYIIYKLKGII
jgi:uncharacterized membrane protein